MSDDAFTTASVQTALQTQIDPIVSFRNSQGQAVRGTILSLQRKSLVMEIYNPYSIVQVSEVLGALTIRQNAKNVYFGNAVITNIVNTGLTIIVSVTLTDVWRVLSDEISNPITIGLQARVFVDEWERRFGIRSSYQTAVNELRTFLAEISRWVEQLDLSTTIPKENEQLRRDYFDELAEPLIEKSGEYVRALEAEAALVEPEHAPVHRAFCQASLHPLMLRAPFVFRTYTKPLGYAGDYQMVNQIIDDPRQGPNTYFKIVNTLFLRASVASAHRNRIDILFNFLVQLADRAQAEGRPFRLLNVGCGPAIEIQRFLQEYEQPQWLQFTLLDFSTETLDWTRAKLEMICARRHSQLQCQFVHESVHNLLRRRIQAMPDSAQEFDAVYCAGLFDYLPDKVCARLMQHFAGRIRHGGKLLVTNVHSDCPEKFSMEHILEWYLIYRDQKRLASLLPNNCRDSQLSVDATGVNVFAVTTIWQA